MRLGNRIQIKKTLPHVSSGLDERRFRADWLVLDTGELELKRVAESELR